MRCLLHQVARWTLAGALFLLAAEGTSRFDDWITFGTPLLANPDRGQDLTLHDALGVHGRPHGRFKKWVLNSAGFRGPEIEDTPAPGITRVVLLGASETFGLYESPDKEYPAQLHELMQQRSGGQVEVINAAMAGITLKSMTPYWTNWVSRFRPQVVVIYPSPLFYLDDLPPASPTLTPPAPDQRGPLFASRFAGRMREELRNCDLLRRLRRQWIVAESVQGKGDDWCFHGVPSDRLEQFVGDLDDLVHRIQDSGARVILVTHAMRATSPPRPEDEFDFLGMRQFFPRAPSETLAAFEEAAAQAVRDYGKSRDIKVIDAAAELNGKREHFADLVHFNDGGAAVFARFLADRLPTEDSSKCVYKK